MDKKTKDKDQPKKRKNRALEIANTLEWLITAFILAFVFRAFVMEAFRIPTGSMADTLMGAHYRLRCSQCGFKYNYGYDVQGNGYKAGYSRCPNCGFYQEIMPGSVISDGDRILVLKCIYQFYEPKRWDVTVFKNPTEPNINYIKRMIGKPGETVEIIDGDIYINGKIARKPEKVQQELWMNVYNNDYQPVNPEMTMFNGHQWQQPFQTGNSNWKICQDNQTRFCLESDGKNFEELVYNTDIGNDFRATYAYNDPRLYQERPYVSDLKISYYVTSADKGSKVGASISKYAQAYKGWIDLDGQMVIAKQGGQKDQILAKGKFNGNLTPEKALPVEFSSLDHQLILRAGNEKLVYDFGTEPNDFGTRTADIEPVAKIIGRGNLELAHIAIYRDTFYTSPSGSLRATEGKPITLEKDQFFVLGDNSPNSSDSRLWNVQGIGNEGKRYRQGIVPKDYLVGKAMFVYWPGGFRPWKNFRLAIVPNVGKMRLIYGGNDQKTADSEIE